MRIFAGSSMKYQIFIQFFIFINSISSLKPFNFVFKFNRSFSFDILRENPIGQSFQKLHYILTQYHKEEFSTNISKDSKISINSDVTIREVDFNDISAVATLRINVFYPEVTEIF
jgi:hypothetical protein